MLNGIANIGSIATTCILVALAVYKMSTPLPKLQPPAAGRHVYDLDKQVFANADRTLLLVLRDGCRYCTESMPFYRELGRLRAESRGPKIRLVAVVLSERNPGAATRYVHSQGLAVDGVVALAGERQKRFGVGATPTLMLVDQTGLIAERWVGLLDASGERRVLDSLFASRSARSSSGVMSPER